MDKETKSKKHTIHKDTYYIMQDDIGKVICKGLASVAKIHPKNPVDYLAKWLLAYHSQTHVQKEVCLIAILNQVCCK